MWKGGEAKPDSSLSFEMEQSGVIPASLTTIWGGNNNA